MTLRRLPLFVPDLVLASTVAPSPIGSCAEGVSLQNTGTVTVYFSPAGDTVDAIVRSIETAHTHMQLASYEFTHPRIARTLTQAADPRRYVDVRVVLDQENVRSSYSVATYLAYVGIRARTD